MLEIAPRPQDIPLVDLGSQVLVPSLAALLVGLSRHVLTHRGPSLAVSQPLRLLVGLTKELVLFQGPVTLRMVRRPAHIPS